MATFLSYINNELLSRRFVARWWDADLMSFSEHEFALGDEVSDNNDYEFKYALADEVDAIIGLEINDAHFMSFNRDDDRHKGVVVRVS